MVEFVAVERGRLGQVASFRRGWGGDTSNFAVAVARVGGSAGYLTRIGSDEFGRSFLTMWKREGVDASTVIVEPDGVTGIYFIALAEDGSHDFTYYRAGSPASRMDRSDVDPTYLARAKIFHTSGVTLAISESAAATAQSAVAMAKRAGLTISYDANVRPKLRPLAKLRGAFEDLAPSVDIMFISTEDAGHLFGPIPAQAIIDRILGSGPRLVVLKQGEAGCLIGDAEGTRLHIPAWPITLVDATGAGDAFDGAFLVERARGASLEAAGKFANAVGALTASAAGAVSAIPTRTEVEEFMAQRRAIF
jgi:2-dehydro-3-deoxygluconokinase